MVRQFEDFLAGAAVAADALYILGDLFEYWAGDDDLCDEFNAAVAASIRRLVRSGTPVFFIAGNRDFLIDAEFARTTGMTRIEEPHLATICGTRTLFLHGDTLCTDDRAYLKFRSEVRSASWRDAFLAQPLAQRRAQIAAMRRDSDLAKRAKDTNIMDANPEAVAALLRAYDYPRLIHGHTHRPARHEMRVDDRLCERWVLGDWYQHGSYLSCDATGCRAVSLVEP